MKYTEDSTSSGMPRLLCVKRVLEEYSDEAHPLTLADITTILKEKYGIAMHRTTLTRIIESLIAFDTDIITVHSTQNQYFIENRLFEIPELRLLCDAIHSSKCLTAEKSRRLTEKLMTLVSRHQADTLRHRPLPMGIIKPKNEQIYYIIDAINTAIESQTVIRFSYMEYSAEKKPVLRQNGKQYTLSPYACIWNGDYYYVIGWNHARNNIAVFRVDRIASTPQPCNEPAVAPPADFDLCQYSTSVFHMFCGDIATVELVCENTLMKTIIDRFGETVCSEPYDADHVKITVDVALSPTFYAWIFEFGGMIRILSPEHAQHTYKQMIKRIAEQLSS